MSNKKKIIIGVCIICLFLVSVAVSYSYFSARISGNETTSTISGTAAGLELTFTDGGTVIDGTNIIPGWSASKTFTVSNTGDETAYYKLKISNINNPLVNGGLSYSVSSTNGGVTIDKTLLPSVESVVGDKVSIGVGVTHNYTITTYYDNLSNDQKDDKGQTFSYTVSVVGVQNN